MFLIVDQEMHNLDYSFDRLITVGVETFGESWSPKGMAIHPNSNQIYNAQDFLESVSIFSDSGDFVNVITHEGWNPWGVAIHDDNLYVTDTFGHSVFHFTIAVDVCLISKLGSRGFGLSQFDEPKQLTVSINGDVFVSDYLNHRIQILDSSLQFKRQISHYSLIQPCEVKLTKYDVYVLSDATPLCIHVFSHAGDKMRSLITCGDGMQVIKPQFFVLTRMGI